MFEGSLIKFCPAESPLCPAKTCAHILYKNSRSLPGEVGGIVVSGHAPFRKTLWRSDVMCGATLTLDNENEFTMNLITIWRSITNQCSAFYF